MAAQVGVTTAFAVGAAASTQIANKNAARQYMLFVNQDPANTVYLCIGTNNGATVLAGIPIPPGGYFELGPVALGQIQAQIAGGGSLGPMPSGDIAAIAAAGQTVNCTYFEF